MSLTKLAVDVLGVVTICLVALFTLLGLFCIIYTLYFRARIRRSDFVQLSYFNGPWVVRISLVLFGIWWGVGEIARLSLFRQRGGAFEILDRKWQEDMCKYYVIANLGFTEPCLFLIMSFLLRASLQWRGSEILNHKWNLKTAVHILLCCLPLFVLDLVVIMIGPKFDSGKSKVLWLPNSFTHTTRKQNGDQSSIVICSYPLLCTILHGLFAVLLTAYLLLVGKRMVASVINKGLRRRVYILIFLVSCFLPLRVILLGFSALAERHLLFEALAFSGFIVLLSCVVAGIHMLVYLPVADSLTFSKDLLGADNRAGRPYSTSAEEIYNYNDSVSLISSSRPIDTSNLPPFSTDRSSDDSTKRGSMSFRMLIRDDPCGAGGSEEMVILSPGLSRHQLSSPVLYPGSPSFIV